MGGPAERRFLRDSCRRSDLDSVLEISSLVDNLRSPLSVRIPDCPICQGTADGLCAPRHVEAWSDLTASEQFAMLAQLGEALSNGARGFTLAVDQGHLRLCLPAQSAQPYRLTTGGDDPLLPLLAQRIDAADKVDLAIAFAMESGVQVITPWFRDLIDRGGRLRIVVGDYLDVTEPAALSQLSDIEGAQVRVFETGSGSFHPKAWLFRAENTLGSAIVGSSNLSRAALTSGVEWNLHSENATDVVATAFDQLWAHPQVRQLTSDWISSYSQRRRSTPLTSLAKAIVDSEPPDPPPLPHPIQQVALKALQETRRTGHRAGLVVLATGLGKTWLAAFDSLPFARVLFVAHRDEILAQAMASFRRIRPDARFGRFDGNDKDEDAEILFASIQTLGRVGHLRRFAPDAFDYIVVDEFHHASAASYRGLLDHFTPRFLLGLTATPDRSDGADLLTLCGDNLVYHCDLFDGIEANLLSPFRYLGVADEVDYSQIPWRSTQFDPTALEAALATEARAANALDQFKRHRDGPAIGFCCSVRHAEFMADYFREQGFRAVAVHSGPGSAPRTTSLEQLGQGEIDILFAVDMFNEGVDVPKIGTVMMLRPTESVILWLQQLGRGLRRVEGKVLRVIDYIGNHRIFLTKLRALLEAGPGDRSLAQKLDQVINGALQLPPGCSVTYDLKVIEILRDLLRQKSGIEEMEGQYRDFRLRNGQRPTATEIARMGFDPTKSGHGSWFDFVRDMGDPVDARAVTSVGDLLRQLERDRTLTLEALNAIISLASGGPAPEEGLAFWAFNSLLRREGERLYLSRPDPGGVGAKMAAELAEWRASVQIEKQVDEPPTPYAGAGPQLWREYMREEIPPLFGSTFSPGNWNSGIVRLDNDLILLTTLKKGGLTTGNHYEDHFLGADRMQWQSQTQTRQDSHIGRMITGNAPGARIHLFVRNGKLRNGKGAPFLYCGRPAFEGWEGEGPITVTWRLSEAVPAHLRASFGIKGPQS
jgi:superfamily II DNA or RNA helicase/HKD family nuclease